MLISTLKRLAHIRNIWSEDGYWLDVLILSFWKVTSFNVGSISFITEKIFLCALITFKLVQLLVGLSWRVTGVVILLFTMTTVVAVSVVRCVIVLFTSAGNSGSFSTMTSISGVFSSFLIPLDVVTKWRSGVGGGGDGCSFLSFFLFRHHRRSFCWN